MSESVECTAVSHNILRLQSPNRSAVMHVASAMMQDLFPTRAHEWRLSHLIDISSQSYVFPAHQWTKPSYRGASLPDDTSVIPSPKFSRRFRLSRSNMQDWSVNVTMAPFISSAWRRTNLITLWRIQKQWSVIGEGFQISIGMPDLRSSLWQHCQRQMFCTRLDFWSVRQKKGQVT